MDYFEGGPCGAVGVQMTNGVGEFLKESKRGYTYIHTSLFKLTGLWRLAPKSSFFNGYYIGNVGKDERCKAPILSGACMAFSHELMDSVGYFDESYFMYCEDNDLSWRMNEASGGNEYLGDLNIIHFKGVSTPRRLKYINSFYKGMTKFAGKYEFPKHGRLVNFVVRQGIHVGFVLAAIKCVVLRAIERQIRPRDIRRVAVVTDDAGSVDRLMDYVPGVVAERFSCMEVGSVVADEYDAVLMDVDGDVERHIKYMQQHVGATLYGFYSDRSRLAFVYEGNGCRTIMG